MNECVVDGWTNACMSGWMDGWTNKQTNDVTFQKRKQIRFFQYLGIYCQVILVFVLNFSEITNEEQALMFIMYNSSCIY